jgi:hypothetical protein
MKMFWGDFNAKVSREDIFKSKIGNELLLKICNDNRVRTHPHFQKSDYFEQVFVLRNIHKHTWIYSGGKTHIQIEYLFIDRTRCILDDTYFRGACSILITVNAVVVRRECQ